MTVDIQTSTPRGISPHFLLHLLSGSNFPPSSTFQSPVEMAHFNVAVLMSVVEDPTKSRHSAGTSKNLCRSECGASVTFILVIHTFDPSHTTLSEATYYIMRSLTTCHSKKDKKRLHRLSGLGCG